MDTLGTDTLITRLTDDINQVQNGLNMGLRLLLRSPFIVLGSMVMAFTIDFKCALVFAVAIPFLFLVVFVIMFFSIPLFKKVQGKLDTVTGLTRENLTGVRVIRAFCREKEAVAEFDTRNQELTKLNLFVGKLSALLNPVTYVLINIATVILIQKAGVEVNLGGMQQGQVVALYNYMLQIIVELMGDGTLPVQLHSLFIIMGGAQIIRHYAGTLRHIRQFLAAAVPTLTHGPGSVAANAVILHYQFRLPPGQLGFLLRGQLGVQVTEQIIRTGRQHLHIAVFVFVDLLLYKGHRGFLGRTAPIADPVENHSAVQIVFFVFIQLLLHKIPVPQLLQRKVIIMGVQTGQHLRAVRPLPHANIKRNAVGAAPTQLLGRKAQQPGVLHHRRQRLAEAKAVRQKNVLRLHAELFLKIPIAKENIAKKCLRRGNIHIAVLIAGTGGIPLAALY